MGLFSWFSRKKKEPAAPAPAPEVKVTEEVAVPASAPVVEHKAAPEVKVAPEVKAAPAAPAEKPVKKPAPAAEKAAPAPAPAQKPAPAAVVKEAPAVGAPRAEEAAPESAPSADPEEGKRLVGKNPDVVVRVVRSEKPVEPAPAPAPAPVVEGPKIPGKYEFELAPDGYRFCLVANNGQLLYESIGFTSLEGATVGIDTFRRAVLGGTFAVISDKYKRYRYVLNRKYYGENYDSRSQCEKAVESVKRFAPDAVITEFAPTEDKVAAFDAARAALRTVKDVDWDAVEAREASAQKLGKFEIVRGEDKEFRFYLVANNGQVLYTGKNYQKLCQCLAGIKAFKRAVYVGNFWVDEDKFGRFRYILKNIGVAPAFMGESYTTRKQCESSIESVKNFVVTAEIELP